MSRRSNRIQEQRNAALAGQQQEAGPSGQRTAIQEGQQEDESVLLPVFVAIFNESGAVFKHWAVFIENEAEPSKSLVLHVEGSVGRFRYVEKCYDVRSSQNLYKTVPVGWVQSGLIRKLKRVVEDGVKINNNDMTWNCQDFAYNAIEVIAGVGVIDGKHDTYINARQVLLREEMEGIEFHSD